MKTGIGGGYTTSTYDENEIIGDCFVEITGGTIRASANEGVGIGGWAGQLPLSSKGGEGTVKISGGYVTAEGGDGCGIGCGDVGWLASIEIAGGIVIATGHEIDPSADRFDAIGFNVGTGINHGRLKKLTITGGTVIARKKDGSMGDMHADAIYINGGNVYANVSGVMASSGGPSVRRNEIDLETWDYAVDWSGVALRAIHASSTNYVYGLKDAFPMRRFRNDIANFHLWLPDGAVVLSADIQPGILPHDSARFTGMAGLLMNEKKLYPATVARLNIIRGAATIHDGRALISYLGGKAEMLRLPITPGKTITGYTFGSNTQDRAMEADGRLLPIPGYTLDTPNWSRKDKATYNDGVDFYAMMEDTLYTFRFSANKPFAASTDMKGQMPDQSCYYTDPVTLTNGYALPGYRFVSWNTKADGTGVRYDETATVRPQDFTELSGSEITLYARWEAMPYEVRFSSGGGAGSMGNQTMLFDQTVALNANTSSAPANQAFAGWRRSPAFGGRLYMDEETVCNLCSVTGDSQSGYTLSGFTLEAQWMSANDLFVIVVNNDAPLSLPGSTHIVLTSQGGTEYTPFSPTGSPGEYICARTGGSLPEAVYQLTIDGIDSEGISVNTAVESVIYLRYCTVDVNADDHSTAWVENPGTSSKAYARLGTLLRIGATVEHGYIFEAFTATGYQPIWQANDPTLREQTITVTGQTQITAHPDAFTYQVQFLANSSEATGTMAVQDMRYEEPMTLFPNAFVRKGYRFGHWSSRPDGGTSYLNGQSVKNLATANGEIVHLYAQWTPITYTVRFNGHNGLGAMDDMTCVYDQTYTVPENRFSLLGSDFEFWNTQIDNTGTLIYDGGTFHNLSDTAGEVVTLYAQWMFMAYGPWISRQPEDVEIYEGGAAIFTIEAGGMQPLAYQWQRNDGTGWYDIDYAREPSYTLLGVAAADDGARFRCHVINANGRTINSISAGLSVRQLMFIRHPVDLSIPSGTSATFTAVIGGKDVAVRWLVNHNDGQGWTEVYDGIQTVQNGFRTSTSCTLSAVPLSRNGDLYMCYAGKNGLSIESRAATLRVIVIPRTGDSATPWLWLLQGMVCLSIILWSSRRIRKRLFQLRTRR